MNYKSILKVVGVVAVAAALCVGCGGDNGVSGGVDPAIYGTWKTTNEITWTFSGDGRYEYVGCNRENCISGHRGRYTANRTNITMTRTEILTEITFNGARGWYTIDQLLNSDICAADIRFCGSFFGDVVMPYSISGDTLTISNIPYTKQK
jgi:hypothetical protein